MSKKDIEITYFQALNAMSQLILIRCDQTFSEDVDDILSNVQIVESDGSTVDSGEWERWLESVYEVLGGEPVKRGSGQASMMERKDKMLTSDQAFDVMCEYLRSFGTLISSRDILAFLQELKENSEWRGVWEKCIEKACTPEGIYYMRLYRIDGF